MKTFLLGPEYRVFQSFNLIFRISESESRPIVRRIKQICVVIGLEAAFCRQKRPHNGFIQIIFLNFLPLYFGFGISLMAQSIVCFFRQKLS